MAEILSILALAMIIVLICLPKSWWDVIEAIGAMVLRIAVMLVALGGIFGCLGMVLFSLYQNNLGHAILWLFGALVAGGIMASAAG